MRSRPVALALAVAAAAACGVAAGPPAGGAARVDELAIELLGEYPHDPDAFTQGLLWHDGKLYESTGEYGASTLRRVDLESGTVELRRELDPELFGEGLARSGERLIQLTWREGVALVWDLRSLDELERRTYDGEGWGLCFDRVELVRTDGSDTLTFHDAGSLAPLRRVRVTLDGRPLRYLNELECVHGEIWANVWQTDSIVRIDPVDGRVTARVDASELRRLLPARGGVLNGIAYRDDRGTFLLTGKNWPRLFEVSFVGR